MTRVTGIAPQPYAVQIDAGAGTHGGIAQTLNGRVAPGWHVLEVDVTLLSGALTGSGIYMHWGPTGGFAYSNQTPFTTTLDITGSAPGAGAVNKLYKFRKLVNVTTDAALFQMFVMAHWEGFGQSIASANSLKFHRAALRPASQAEIEARQATTDLVTANANIATNASAIASEAGSRAAETAALTARFVANQKNSQNMLRNSTFRDAQHWTPGGSPILTGQAYADHVYAYMAAGGGHRYLYQDVRVEVGARYALSGDIYSDNDNVARVYVQWLIEDKSAGAGANSGYQEPPSYGAHPGWRRVTFDINNANHNGGYGLVAPSGAGWARIFVDNWPGTGTAGGAAWRRIKFERGDYATAWAEDDGFVAATEAMATATSASSAASTANSSIATLTTTVSANYSTLAAADTSNYNALAGSLGGGSANLLRNTDFHDGTTEGWETGWDGTIGGSFTRDFATGEWTGTVKTRYVYRSGTPTVDTVIDDIVTARSSLALLKRWAVPTKGSERFWAGAWIGAHRCRGFVEVAFYDAAGAYISETGQIGSASYVGGFQYGDPNNAERVGLFFTTPSNARYIVFWVRMISTGEAEPYLFWGRPMIASATAAQTDAPPYVSGGFDRAINATITTTNAQVAANTSAIATETSARATAIEEVRAYLSNKGDLVHDEFRDNAFWNLPVSGVTLADADTGWTFRRWISFANGTYDLYSDFFPVEPGATYRIRCRIWNNAGSWSGYFHPLIHMPYHAWYSLKHGGAVDPGVHDATNGIVAAGDTLDLEWIYTNPTGITNNANREWQFRFLGSFTGGPVVIACEIIRLDQYATVTTTASSLATLEAASAVWEVVAAASGGTPARVGVKTGLGGSEAWIDASKIYHGDNTTFEDPYNSFYTEASSKRFRFGGPFPASGDMVMWFGPTSVALNSETKTNGYFCFATDGKVYYGASELAANLTATASPASSTVTHGAGVFSTGSITITPVGGSGHTYAWDVVKTSGAGAAPTMSSYTNASSTASCTLSAGQDVQGFIRCTVTASGGHSTSVIIPFSFNETS